MKFELQTGAEGGGRFPDFPISRFPDFSISRFLDFSFSRFSTIHSLALAATGNLNRKRAPKADDSFPVALFSVFQLFPHPLACARGHNKGAAPAAPEMKRRGQATPPYNFRRSWKLDYTPVRYGLYSGTSFWISSFT
jgi:hypothetical protein